MLAQPHKEKFEEIVAAHRDQVYRVCWGFAKNAFDIDDIFQEVMINIWKGIEGFQGNAAMSTWIYRITVNTCLLWKKRNKNKKLSHENIDDLVIKQEEEFSLEKDIQLLELRKAIQQLKKVDRTLILLVLEECSYKEIAEITGLTLSNVGVKISRIKTRIKKIMTK